MFTFFSPAENSANAVGTRVPLNNLTAIFPENLIASVRQSPLGARAARMLLVCVFFFSSGYSEQRKFGHAGPATAPRFFIFFSLMTSFDASQMGAAFPEAALDPDTNRFAFATCPLPRFSFSFAQ